MDLTAEVTPFLTSEPSTYLSQKWPLDNKLFLSWAQHSGTHYRMMFITQYQHLLSSNPLKFISSNLHIINTPFHLCACVCVCVCVRTRVYVWACAISHYIFVFAVYLLVSYMCAEIRVWSCLVADNFGLSTEIAVCKFLRGWRSYGLKPFYFVHCMCLYIFLQLFVQRIVP